MHGDKREQARRVWVGGLGAAGDRLLMRAGRSPLRGVAKRQLTLRLDPDVVERFRAEGPGWRGRISETLRKVVGLT